MEILPTFQIIKKLRNLVISQISLEVTVHYKTLNSPSSLFMSIFFDSTHTYETAIYSVLV